MGLLFVVYVVSRTLGKISGAFAGGYLAGAEPSVRNWIGLTLLPQAGIAMGLALIAIVRFPEYRDVLLTIVPESPEWELYKKPPGSGD